MPIRLATDVPSVNTSCQDDLEFLSDTSPRDKPWDQHKSDTNKTAWAFRRPQVGDEFKKKAARLSKCAEQLAFTFDRSNPDGNGEVKTYRLENAMFCRVRNCPTCQWRRSLLWKAKFYNALPGIVAAAPKGRWLFATFTIRNCEVEDLKATIKRMNSAWVKLRKRVEFKNVIGWVRTTEVTRNRITNQAHPHFHVLFLVKSTYFKSGYIKSEDWSKCWQECLEVDYAPQVKVQAVYDKKTGKKATNGDIETITDAVAETLKYAVKPADMFDNLDFFYELCRQINKQRFIAAGGLLKDCFKEDTKSEDLLLKDEDAEPDGKDEPKPILKFTYERSFERYARNRKTSPLTYLAPRGKKT